MGLVRRALVGAATFAGVAGAAAVARRLGRHSVHRKLTSSDHQPTQEQGPAPEIELQGGEGAVHLMLEDGSVVEADGDLDPDGRFRYLADHLFGDPDRG